MLKAIRCLLHGIAISSGVAGLLAGGFPLAKYAIFKWFHGPDSDFYDDPNYLFSPEVIFLLSLILLICVHASFVLGRGIHPASFPKPDSSGISTTEESLARANEISGTAKVTGTTGRTIQEAADEKLARLLNQKKD